MSFRTAFFVLAITGFASAAAAQTDKPGPSLEFHTGWAAFVDESPVNHGVFGAAYRFHLSPRVSIGPEVAYMIGPGDDRDFFLTADVWLDTRAPSATSRPVVVPYFVIGGGVMFHRNFLFPNGAEWFAKEPAVTGGMGVRFNAGKWYVAPELRLGWETHMRVSAAVGYRFNR